MAGTVLLKCSAEFTYAVCTSLCDDDEAGTGFRPGCCGDSGPYSLSADESAVSEAFILSGYYSTPDSNC